mmetsp:Transcript_3768/g.11667  ORF Transcript_3768/g.11667 Transcript_3768/m.11667 type:complete len:225 (-) Transcript_3768:216-890(-)
MASPSWSWASPRTRRGVVPFAPRTTSPGRCRCATPNDTPAAKGACTCRSSPRSRNLPTSVTLLRSSASLSSGRLRLVVDRRDDEEPLQQLATAEPGVGRRSGAPGDAFELQDERLGTLERRATFGLAQEGVLATRVGRGEQRSSALRDPLQRLRGQPRRRIARAQLQHCAVALQAPQVRAAPDDDRGLDLRRQGHRFKASQLVRQRQRPRPLPRHPRQVHQSPR